MDRHVLESIHSYRVSCVRQLTSIRNRREGKQSNCEFIGKSQFSNLSTEAIAKYFEKLIEVDRLLNENTCLALDESNPLKIFKKYAGVDAINALGKCSVHNVMDWTAEITGAFWIADFLFDGMFNAEEHDENYGFRFGRVVFAVSLLNSAATENTIIVRVDGEHISCYLLSQEDLRVFEDRSNRILFAIEAWDEFDPIYELCYDFKFVQRIRKWIDDVVGVFPVLSPSRIERSKFQILDAYYSMFKEKGSEIAEQSLEISFDQFGSSQVYFTPRVQQSTFLSTIKASEQKSLLYLINDTETKKKRGNIGHGGFSELGVDSFLCRVYK